MKRKLIIALTAVMIASSICVPVTVRAELDYKKEYEDLQDDYDELEEKYNELRTKYRKLKKKYDALKEENDSSETKESSTAVAKEESKEKADTVVEETTVQSDEEYVISNIYFYTHTSSYSSSLYYDAVVTIHNTSDHAIYLDNCTFDIEDQSGHLVSTYSYVSRYPDIVLPGCDGYFYQDSVEIENEIPSDEIKFVPHISVEKSRKENPVYYEIDDVSLKTGSWDDLSVIGRIINTTSEKVDYYYVHALFYDDFGNVIGIQGTSITDMMPGVPKSFEISCSFGSKEVSNGAFSTFVVDAQEYYYQFG